MRPDFQIREVQQDPSGFYLGAVEFKKENMFLFNWNIIKHSLFVLKLTKPREQPDGSPCEKKVDVGIHLVVVVRLALDDRVARVEVVGALDGEGVVEGARVEREAAAVPSDLKRGHAESREIL